MAQGVMSFIDAIIFKWWWVVLFLLICYMLFEQAERRQKLEFAKLQQLAVDLEKERVIADEENQKLLLHVNSQSDPAWVELVLMRGLGLVPEGQTKVFFTNQE